MSEPERSSTISDELGKFLDRSEGRELKDVQVQNVGELTLIRRDLRRMSRQLLVSNIITTLLLVFFGATLLFPSFRTFLVGSSGVPELESDRGFEEEAAVASPSESLYPPPWMATREPLSPDDRAIYPLVYDLYLRARGFRQTNPPGSVAALNGRRERYVQFLSDAAKLAEQAAEKSVSQDLLQLIVKIAEFAKQNFQHIGLEQPPTISLDNQIRAVLREYTPREDGRLDPRRM